MSGTFDDKNTNTPKGAEMPLDGTTDTTQGITSLRDENASKAVSGASHDESQDGERNEYGLHGYEGENDEDFDGEEVPVPEGKIVVPGGAFLVDKVEVNGMDEHASSIYDYELTLWTHQTPTVVNGKVTYNEYTLELDLQDEETMQHYEDCCARLEGKHNKFEIDMTGSGYIRTFCNLFRDFFDDVFGGPEDSEDGIGWGEKLIGKKNNLRIALTTYESFLLFANKQNANTSVAQNAILQRFRPTQYAANRTQRRSQKNQKKRRY